jgi:hypothetical protein
MSILQKELVVLDKDVRSPSVGQRSFFPDRVFFGHGKRRAVRRMLWRDEIVRLAGKRRKGRQSGQHADLRGQETLDTGRGGRFAVLDDVGRRSLLVAGPKRHSVDRIFISDDGSRGHRRGRGRVLRATKSSVSAKRDGEAGTADVISDGEGQGRWIPRKVGGTILQGSSRAFESIRAYQSSREDVKSTRGQAEVALRQRPAVANPLAGLSMWTSGNGTCLASTPTSCASRSRLERPRIIPTSILGCYTRSPPKAENCLSIGMYLSYIAL